MTDHARNKLQRRQKLPPKPKRKQLRLLLSALVLVLGYGAFLFQQEKFAFISKILVGLDENRPREAMASTASTPPRGNIYDRNFRPLAATYETYAVYARPLEVEDPAATAKLLEEILGLDRQDLATSLKSERGFVWIARNLDRTLADTIKDRDIKGLYQIAETRRFYPNYKTAAHVVGFVEDDQGLDGIEFQYNSLLRGDEISEAELEILNFKSAAGFGRATTHLVLNLDLLIQTKIEQYLARRVRITGAASGCVLLMDADTGAILGLASFPAFNPNRYWEFSSGALSNHAISEPVYPGELALIFQQAAALNRDNERKSAAPGDGEDPETVPIIEPEILKRRRLAAAPRIDAVEPEYLADFARLLGFNRSPATDIPLKNETPADSALLLTDPLFHTSALRLLTGFTVLVNNGRMVTPHLLHQAYPADGDQPVGPVPPENKQAGVLHPDTSSDLVDFLARKWLKMDHSSSTAGPMFFESHRFETPVDFANQAGEVYTRVNSEEQDPRLSQSILLGAIPGRAPRLTMIAVLSYPGENDDTYPDALESLGRRFSILKPDQEMIQKLAYLADQSPPVPSPDFWANSTGSPVGNMVSDAQVPGESAWQPPADIKIMPDVTGKSLRAGLQTLQHFNLKIRLVGNGRIVEQHPEAGAELNNGSTCILKLQQEI